MKVEAVQIASRFQGPPRSGNGGYSCGLLARRLAGTVSARLKAPPPPDTLLRFESDAETAWLRDGDVISAAAADK